MIALLSCCQTQELVFFRKTRNSSYLLLDMKSTIVKLAILRDFLDTASA